MFSHTFSRFSSFLTFILLFSLSSLSLNFNFLISLFTSFSSFFVASTSFSCSSKLFAVSLGSLHLLYSAFEFMSSVLVFSSLAIATASEICLSIALLKEALTLIPTSNFSFGIFLWYFI